MNVLVSPRYNLVPETKLRSQLLSAAFVAFSFSLIMLNLVTLVVKEADHLYLFGFAINVISFLPVPFFVIESPQWLSKKGLCSKSVKSLKKIAAKNGNPIKHGEVEEAIGYEQDLDRETRRITITQGADFDDRRDSKGYTVTMYDKEIIFSIFAISLIVFTCNSIYSGLAISLAEIGGDNIQVNGITFGIFQGVGYSIIVKKSPDLPRTKSIFFMHLMVLLGGLALLGLSFAEQTQTIKYINGGICSGWITIFISMSFPMYYLLIAETFPTEIRGTASSICLLAGKLLVIMIPKSIAMVKDKGYHPIIGALFPVLISLPLTLFLKETNGGKKARLK